MRFVYLLTAGAIATGAVLAAPATKEKDRPLGPITHEQLHQAEQHLKEVGLAWHNYESTYGEFPSNIADKDGKGLLSWRVQILPYIEQDALYKEFRLDEPWDSEHNKKLIDRMPAIYAPVRGKADAGMTFLQSTTGKKGLIRTGEKCLIASVTDGLSNTFMAVEAARPVIWTKPDDLVFDGKDVPALGGMFDGKFHACMGDGAVHRFKKGVEVETLRRLIDPKDGMVVDYAEAEDKGDK